jgi:hypothetical protein
LERFGKEDAVLKRAGIRDVEFSPGANASLSELRRAAALTGLVGAAFAVLFLASLYLLSSAPRPKESDQAYMDFYASDERRKVVLVGLYMLPFAAVAFIWFIAALRQWVAHSQKRGSQIHGTVQLVSGVAFITLALASAAASTMPAALVELSDNGLDPAMARDFPLYGNALLLVFGVRMAAMFVVTTTNIAMKIGFMPRWFGAISIILALILFLSASLSVWLVVLFPLWVLAFGVLIIAQAYRMDPDSPLLQSVRSRVVVESSPADDVIQ